VQARDPDHRKLAVLARQGPYDDFARVYPLEVSTRHRNPRPEECERIITEARARRFRHQDDGTSSNERHSSRTPPPTPA
jgi:hypothetical protein